jgi:uncharacterized protein (DUF58 family)
MSRSEQPDILDFLDPRLLSTVEDLELIARGVVEGFQHGLHRSPYIGFSIEFASHREYLPGDDLRHVNWKLFGRQDRLYIKEYDAQTNLEVHLVLDVSRSMQTATSGVSKLRYATMLAASIAHLALSQRDAVGITMYADSVVQHVKPRAHPDQLFEILHPLAGLKSYPTADTPRALHEVAELVPRRGLVVLVGDLYFATDELSECLDHFRHFGQELLLFHVLDPIEHRLPLDGPVKFRDLETGEEVVTQAHELRNVFRDAVVRWQEELGQCCRGRDIDYVPLVTDARLDQGLTAYLARRAELY